MKRERGWRCRKRGEEKAVGLTRDEVIRERRGRDGDWTEGARELGQTKPTWMRERTNE